MEPLPVDVPVIIRELLLRGGLSQRSFAARAGLAQQTLSHYALGRRRPPLEVLERIAAAAGFQLRVSVEPLASDVLRDMELIKQQTVDEWLDELGLLWTGTCKLLDGVPHRFEGLIAARLAGVPVANCSVIDVAVLDDEESLTAILRNSLACYADLRVPGSSWASPVSDLELLRVRQEDDVLYWQPYRIPELRMRLVQASLSSLISASHVPCSTAGRLPRSRRHVVSRHECSPDSRNRDRVRHRRTGQSGCKLDVDLVPNR